MKLQHRIIFRDPLGRVAIYFRHEDVAIVDEFKATFGALATNARPYHKNRSKKWWIDYTPESHDMLMKFGKEHGFDIDLESKNVIKSVAVEKKHV